MGFRVVGLTVQGYRFRLLSVFCDVDLSRVLNSERSCGVQFSAFLVSGSRAQFGQRSCGQGSGFRV